MSLCAAGCISVTSGPDSEVPSPVADAAATPPPNDAASQATLDAAPADPRSDAGDAALTDANKCGATAEFAPTQTGEANGDVGWNVRDKALVLDDAGAKAGSVTSGTVSKYLFLGGFGASLPPNTQVTGIEVRVRRQSAVGSPKDSNVRLATNGVPFGSDLAKPDIWPDQFADIVYGGSRELWGGASISSATLADLQFAIRVTSQINSATAELDGVALRVHYCEN